MELDEKNIKTQLPDYKSEIIEILRSKLTPGRMRRQILDYHKNDIAGALELLERDERLKLYSILDIEALTEIFEYSSKLADYIGELSIKKRVEILSQMEVTMAVQYLECMTKENRNTLIELMPEESKKEIALLMSFDDDEIGSKMSTNFISVRYGIGVREAMRELVSQAADNDNISTIYVVDKDDTFIGAIDLKDLIIARDTIELDSITVTSYPYVYGDELIDDCIERIKEYSEDSIPVLDVGNKLRGVLTSQDITQLVDDGLADDYAKLAGLSEEDDLNEPLKKSIGKRLPWLIILLGLGLMVSAVVSIFEGVVSSLTFIVSFQSLILGMAGNAGTQSLAVTIRVLIDEQVSIKEKLMLVSKELRIGFINGLILGSLSFVIIGTYLMIIKGQSAELSFSVSLCAGIALLVAIVLSSVSGTVIPLLFKKLKIDPAVASGPLISTLNDLVAVVSYYGLAWILLINILGL